MPTRLARVLIGGLLVLSLGLLGFVLRKTPFVKALRRKLSENKGIQKLKSVIYWKKVRVEEGEKRYPGDSKDPLYFAENENQTPEQGEIKENIEVI